MPAKTRSQDVKKPVTSKKSTKVVKATLKKSVKPVGKSSAKPVTKSVSKTTVEKTIPQETPIPKKTPVRKSPRKTKYKLLSDNAVLRLSALADSLVLWGDMGEQADGFAARILLLQNDMQKEYHALGHAAVGLNKVRRLLQDYAKDASAHWVSCVEQVLRGEDR